jgi:flagellar protein FliO/FliZ
MSAYSFVVALAETPPWPSDASALRTLVATIAVVALIGGIGWLMRRQGFTFGRRGTQTVTVESAIPLGERRSLVVVSVEGRRLLLGLTPVQVSMVTELSPPRHEFDRSLDRALHPSEGS